LPIEPYEEVLAKFPVGVYYGWASVSKKEAYKMAMSIGWNPYFKNSKKTIEVHIIHEFAQDFYGEELRAIALGFERTELDFKSLDDLIHAIKDDVQYAEVQLELPQNKKFQNDAFFTKS